jgi:glycosidase
MRDFYRRLVALRRETPALWSGSWGAPMINVPNDHPDEVLSFVRQDDGRRVLAIFNFSANPITVRLGELLYVGRYQDFFSGLPLVLSAAASVELDPWSYKLLLADR